MNNTTSRLNLLEGHVRVALSCILGYHVAQELQKYPVFASVSAREDHGRVKNFGPELKASE